MLVKLVLKIKKEIQNIDFKKDYNEFKKKFKNGRRKIFKSIVKTHGYSSSVIKKLGYEDVIVEIKNEKWINIPLVDRIKKLKELKFEVKKDKLGYYANSYCGDQHGVYKFGYNKTTGFKL